MASAISTYVAKRASNMLAPASGTATMFTQADSASLAPFVAVPRAASSTTSLLDGATVYIRASGTVFNGSGGTSTFLPGIYYSAAARTQITAVSGNLVAGSASTALAASTTYPWFCETTLTWDSTSLVLGGYYDQYVGIASGLVTQAVVINLLSAVNLATDGAGFVCGITMGTQRTGTIIALKQFILEVM